MAYSKFHGEIQLGKHVDETIKDYFPNTFTGVFFDVGAYEPVNISNSYHFEKNGWDVYCFEANPLLIGNLRNERSNVFNYAISNEDKNMIEFNVVHGCWGGGSLTAGISAIDLDPLYLKKYSGGIRYTEKVQVPQKTLNTVISTEIPHLQKIDVMSIDVEGGELNVLKGLDLNKYKPTLLVIENVFNTPDIRIYLENNGYKLDKCVEYNHYYIRR